MRGEGVGILIGGLAGVRMPPEFIGGSWEDFEPESVATYLGWLRTHPEGVILDIGCSIGIYSAIALFAEPDASVVAFDADLGSIRATRRMVKHASGDRVRLVFGFLAANPTECVSLSQAVETTSRLVDTADIGSSKTRFVCLGDPQATDVPRRRLDDLFPTGFDGRACLIKCDVEGAEQIVLSGARNVLSCYHPDILLSVHPFALPQYGHDQDTLRALLTRLDYKMHCIAIDHEEHWWCTVAK